MGMMYLKALGISSLLSGCQDLHLAMICFPDEIEIVTVVQEFLGDVGLVISWCFAEGAD